VNGLNDTRILPLVYALMSSKRNEIYNRLFEELGEIVNRLEFELRPNLVFTDFEKAAVNSMSNFSLELKIKVVFFTWHTLLIGNFKMLDFLRDMVLVLHFSLMMGQLPALEF
jgi:hypothetical protein